MSDAVTFKVVTIGNTGVGKTSLLHYAVHRRCEDTCKPTIGGAHQQLDVEFGGRLIKLNLWDTAGSEKFKAIVPMYFHEASVALFIFDITKQDSFDALPEWERLIENQAPETMKKIIVGNKSDLEDSRQVLAEQAQDYAHACGALMYIETSAMNGSGIDDLFRRIAQGDDLKPQLVSREMRAQAIEKEEPGRKATRACC